MEVGKEEPGHRGPGEKEPAQFLAGIGFDTSGRHFHEIVHLRRSIRRQSTHTHTHTHISLDATIECSKKIPKLLGS